MHFLQLTPLLTSNVLQARFAWSCSRVRRGGQDLGCSLLVGAGTSANVRRRVSNTELLQAAISDGDEVTFRLESFFEGNEARSTDEQVRPTRTCLVPFQVHEIISSSGLSLEGCVGCH